MVGSRQNLPSWISAAAVNRVDFEGNVSSMSETMLKEGSSSSSSSSEKGLSDVNLGFGERAFSAAGAAVLSAILVNPLDVAKVFNFYDTHLLISSYFERFFILLCIFFSRYFNHFFLLYCDWFCIGCLSHYIFFVWVNFLFHFFNKKNLSFES